MEIFKLPPGSYFISHAYRDRTKIASLIEALPPASKPFLFPAIDCSPLEFVSNTLIGSIMACDGLIYLRAKHSDDSFWVAFEREFALRTGKRVAAYKWSTRTFEPVRRPPIDLQLFFSAAPEDYSRLRQLRTFMADKRLFEFIFPHEEMLPEKSGDTFRALFETDLGISVEYQQQLYWSWGEHQVRHILSKSVFREGATGNLVMFWSRHSPRSPFQSDDLRVAQEVVENVLGQIGETEQADAQRQLFNELNKRVLFVRLDDTPLPHWVRDPVQLYGDEERSEINRIDDVIVALYWKFVSHAEFRAQLREIAE